MVFVTCLLLTISVLIGATGFEPVTSSTPSNVSPVVSADLSQVTATPSARCTSRCTETENYPRACYELHQKWGGGLVKHQDAEGDIVQPLQGLAEALAVPRHPAVRPLYDPPPWQEHEPLLRLGEAHYHQVDPVAGRVGIRIIAGVALVDERDLDRLPGHRLHGLGQHGDLVPLLLIGRGDVHGQQVPERIHRHVDLRALAPLISVVAGPTSALGCGLHRATVEDGGGRLGLLAGGEAEHGAEVVDHGLEAAGGQPAATLLVDHLPGREVLGQVAPRRAGANDPPQAVEDVAEVIDPLAGVLGQEAEIGDDEFPFGVGDIAGIGLVSDHTLFYAGDWTKVHNTL